MHKKSFALLLLGSFMFLGAGCSLLESDEPAGSTSPSASQPAIEVMELDEAATSEDVEDVLSDIDEKLSDVDGITASIENTEEASADL